MTAFDWRLMYGVFRSNFKKHDHYTNLKHTPLNKTLAKLGSKVLERIKKIKTSGSVEKTMPSRLGERRPTLFRESIWEVTDL